MKILITGIAGSGASYLSDWILKNKSNVEIHGISRWHSTTNKNNIDNRVIVHECDMTDFGSLLRIIREINPDWIFHMASYANVRASFDTPISVINNNILCTLNLFEVLRSENMINTRVQLCSTSEVYGIVDEKNVPINESCPLNPANPYAASKLMQDNLAYIYHISYGLDIVRTRAFTYINPRRADLFATAFATQIIKIERGELKILKHGNLNSVRTVIDVRDMCEAYWLALEFGISGEVYNIGGSIHMTVGEFLNLLISKSTSYIRCELDQNLLRPIDVTLQIPDITKFKNETNWSQKYSLNETVDFLLNELRNK